MLFSKKKILKIMRFYMVGGIAFIGNTLIVSYFYDKLHFEYYRCVIIMLIFAIPIFFLQKFLTFKNKSGNTMKQLYGFILLVIAFQMIGLYAIPYFGKLFGSYVLSMVVFTLLFTIVSFCIQQFVLFINHKDVGIKNS